MKSTQVLSIICNTICSQMSLDRTPLQSLDLFLLISSRISSSIVSVILTKYHYIILTDFPGIQFHRYISYIILILKDLHATCFLVINSSYQCLAIFGTATDLYLGRVNGDFINRHLNSFHQLRHY